MLAKKSDRTNVYFLHSDLGRIMIDTGSEKSLLAESLVRRRGVPTEPESTEVHLVQNRIAHSDSVAHEVLIRVGTARLSVRSAVVIQDSDLKAISIEPDYVGILGMDILRNYRLEFGDQSLLLSNQPRETFPATERHVLGFESTFPTSVNSHTIVTLVDTGSFLGISLLSQANDLKRFLDSLEITREIPRSLVDLVIPSYEGLFVVQESKIAGVTVGPITVPAYRRTMDGAPEAGKLVIGVPFLEATHAILDYPHQQILFPQTPTNFSNTTDDYAVVLEKVPQGFLIQDVFERSRLHSVGMSKGDILTHIDGTSLAGLDIDYFYGGQLWNFTHVDATREPSIE